MATNQLLRTAICDRAEVAQATFFQQEREEDDLEEDVTQLVMHLVCGVPARGICQLIGLFDRVRNYRPRILLAIPWAFAPQRPGDLVQALDRLKGPVAHDDQVSPSGSAGRDGAARE